MLTTATAAHQQTTTANAVLTILNSTRAAEIPNILKGLGEDQQDKLMAYLYKVGTGAEAKKPAERTGNGWARTGKRYERFRLAHMAREGKIYP